MRMRAKVVTNVAVTPVAAAAGVVLGIRTRYPPVVDLVRRLARDSGNPRVLKTAGTAGSPTSIIEHTGRTSGRAFQTPVTPTQTANGFVIALPYGPGTDWVKNVLASGSAYPGTRRADLRRGEARSHPDQRPRTSAPGNDAS